MSEQSAYFYTTTELRYPSITVEQYDVFYVSDTRVLPDGLLEKGGEETYDYLNENGFWQSGFLEESPEIPDDEQGEQLMVVTSYDWDIR